MFFAKKAKVLGRKGMKVLMMFLARVDFGNRLVLNQAELGRELGIDLPSVQKAIKQLVRMRVISAGPKSGQNRLYQLNPELVWKGDLENQPKALEVWHRGKRMKAARITGVVEGGKAEDSEE